MLTSLLDAVNTCLRAIGESPVNTIDNDVQSADVALALAELEVQSKKLQAKGWSFNREYSFPVQPDSGGNITLPSNTLRVDTAYGQHSSALFKVAQRGLKLYNSADHNFIFPETLLLDLILQLSWDELPEPARLYIQTQAAFMMQAQLPSDASVNRILAGDVAAALALLEQHEDEVDDTNQITGNVQVQNVLHGHGVRRRP